MKFTTFLMIAIAIAIGYGMGWHVGKGGTIPNPMSFFPQQPAAAPGSAPVAAGTTTSTSSTANLAPPPASQVPGSQSTVLTADQISSCKDRCGMVGPQVCYRGIAKINRCQAVCEGATDADLRDTTCNMGRG